MSSSRYHTVTPVHGSCFTTLPRYNGQDSIGERALIAGLMTLKHGSHLQVAAEKAAKEAAAEQAAREAAEKKRREAEQARQQVGLHLRHA